MTETHPFYGVDILRDREQAYINRLLKKYKKHPANDELKKAIFDELTNERALGNIKIPFKVVLRNAIPEKFPPCIEVILDSKV